jgi:hypothetical protein
MIHNVLLKGNCRYLLNHQVFEHGKLQLDVNRSDFHHKEMIEDYQLVLMSRKQVMMEISEGEKFRFFWVGERGRIKIY